MAPAIRHAEDGFPVYLTLAQFIEENEDKLKRYKGSANTFWPDGEPLQAGELLVQSELAATLSKISDGGADRFYIGELIIALVMTLFVVGKLVYIYDIIVYKSHIHYIMICD